MKIGLLGGTFNPIHIGHLVLAQECWHKFALDKVIFIPDHTPPHKKLEGNVPVLDRLNMVRLALKGNERFEISTYEIDRGGISYAVDTIKYFKEKFGKDIELFFLTGSDSAENLSKWKDIDEILSLTHFVVAARPGWKEESSYDTKVQRIFIPSIEVSSTTIRERVRKNEPIKYLVPPGVVRYIRDKGLYTA